VDIYRDDLGIPQVYASSLHDLFMAQGYLHAQERFWQMDFWRHIASGRLSEMFGETQVETDSFLRSSVGRRSPSRRQGCSRCRTRRITRSKYRNS
jgi:acyl-homoserine lactone acylase PvdQ